MCGIAGIFSKEKISLENKSNARKPQTEAPIISHILLI